MAYKRRWFLRLEEFRLPMARSVATVAPMKRGLKGYNVSISICTSSVATVAPMKRGLKVIIFRLHIDCYIVATVAPMKRGLKADGKCHNATRHSM